MKVETPAQLAPPPQEFCQELLRDKYALTGEETVTQIRNRVAKSLAADPSQEAYFRRTLESGFVPGGRINRAAGADLHTTMINCFVQPVGDAMVGQDESGRPGIMDALAQSAQTMRLGGGVGYDFSPIRPLGAKVKGTDSAASGPVSYMRVFDQSCETIESAGARRGAQMGILRVDHPDIELFIDAKKKPNFEDMGLDKKEAAALATMMGAKATFGQSMRKALANFSNFNLSVAVTDEFMAAVYNDTTFDLVHQAQPSGDQVVTKPGPNGVGQFVYRTVRARDIWDRIMRNTYEGAEPGVIFIDRVNRDNNLWYAESISACNPCGEQFLPAYGCCCLGSVMVQLFVKSPFTDQAAFMWDEFRRCVQGAVRMLDRVLDVTNWPLPQQAIEAANKRRIGLGYLGAADAMAKLGIRYNSAQGVAFMAELTKELCNTAYRESIQLAKELGPFPLFNAEKYLTEGTFASRLPDDIKDDIKEFGMRNSHLLSLAPTGTIAMAFGDNASAGVEPIFSKRQVRTKRLADGTSAKFNLDNGAYREFKRIHGEAAESGAFVTAMEMSVDDHIKVLEAVAPYIDSAISKTVNVPADCPFEEFSDVYVRAHKAGLKGITTYRPNAMMGSVIADADAKAQADDLPMDDPDRRIELKDVSNITSALRWPNRPVTPKGTESVTYSVNHPQGDFAIVVGHYQNGKKVPMEVYVAGNEQPRGLAAIAKVLSVDMRTLDAAWLAMKLDSLANTQADDGFEMIDPATEQRVRVPSLVAGFSRFVSHRLDSIGALTVDGPSQMVNALFSKREPKTGPLGAIGWDVDVRNDVTGDDFLMHTKEARMQDGTVRPYSVWLSGRYPRVLDGLTKVLSIDMRVSDTAWVINKLRKLTNFGEQRGDFLAQVPGLDKQQNYPSTVAYMAALLLHRYKVLGLDVRSIEDTSDQTLALPMQTAGANVAGTGLQCPSCHTMSLHKRDGCKVCDHCDYVGDCG